MKTTGKIILGITVAAAVGIAMFFGTRRAAAASAAAKGFEIDDGCERITLVDQQQAEKAIRDAALVAYRGLKEPAIDLLNRVLGAMFPQCNLTSATVFVVPGPGGVQVEVPLGLIQLGLLNKTVGDVKAQAEAGDLPPGLQLEGAPAPGGAATKPRTDYIPNVLFGGIP